MTMGLERPVIPTTSLSDLDGSIDHHDPRYPITRPASLMCGHSCVAADASRFQSPESADGRLRTGREPSV